MAEYARLVIAADSRQIRDAEHDLSLLERQSNRTESAAVSMAAKVGVAFAGLKLADRAKDAVLLASRYEQMGLVMETVGRNAGRSTVELAALDQMLQETGISAMQSRNNLIKMMSANIDLAQATKLARLAQDAAVIGNTNSSEAFERLITGIQTAQVETLRNMGLNVDFAGSYDKLAKELDTTADALNEQQRIQARTNAAMEAGANIAGVYETSLDNALKKLGSTSRVVENIILGLGENALPAFGAGVDAYAASLDFLQNNIDGVSQAIKTSLYVAVGLASAAMAKKALVTGLVARETHKSTLKELQLAQAQVAQTAASLRQAQSLVVLGGAHSQVVAASAAHEASVKRLSAAQAAHVGIGRGLVGVMGGPLGLAVTASAVALSFATWSDSADEAVERATALGERLDKLGDSYDNLTRASTENALNDATKEQEEWQQAAQNTLHSMQDLTLQHRRTGVSIREGSAAWREYREALNNGEDVGEATEAFLAAMDPTEKLRAEIWELASAYEENANKAEAAGERAALLEGHLESLRNTTAELTEEIIETDDAGEKWLSSLQRQVHFLGELSEVEKAQIALKHGYAGVVSEADKATALYNASLIDQAKAQQEAAEAAKRSQDAYRSLYDDLYPAEAAQREYNEQLELLKQNLSGNHLANAIQLLNKRFDETNPDSRALREYQRELQRLEDRLDPAGRAAREFAKEQKLLREEIERSGDPTGRYTQLLVQLEDEYRRNTEATSQWAQWTESALERVDSAFADAWRNITDGFSSFRDNLTDAFKQMLAELAHLAITRPIVLQIGAAMGIGGGAGMAGIGGGGGGGGGIGDMFTMAGMGKLAQSGWGGIKGLATGQGLSGFGGMLGSQITSPVLSEAAFSQIALEQGLAAAYAADIGAGAGTSMAASFKSGIADVLKNLKGAASNPVTWIAAGMIASNQLYGAGVRASGSRTAEWAEDSSALGKVAWAPFTAGSYAVEGMDKLIGSIFGGRLTAIATGSPVFQAVNDVIGRAIFGNQEQFKRTVGSAQGVYAGGEYTGMGAIESFYGGSRRFGDDFDQALHGINEMFSRSLGSLFDTFDIDAEISTEAKARLRRTSGRLVGEFTVGFEDAAVTILGQYSKKGRIEEGMEQFFDEVMGRGLVEAIAASPLPEYLKELTAGLTDADEVGSTISGLLQRYESVNAVFETLSLASFDLSDSGLRASDSLLALAGGIENLLTATDFYYQNFYSEQERLAKLTEQTTSAIEAMGLALPDSRQGFRDLIEGLDRTTEAGQAMFLQLLNLAPAMHDIALGFEEAAKAAEELARAGLDSAFADLRTAVEAEKSLLGELHQLRIVALSAERSAVEQSVRDARTNVDSVFAAFKRGLDAQREQILQSSQLEIDALSAERDSILGIYSESSEQIRAAMSAASASISELSGVVGTLERGIDAMRIQGAQADVYAHERGLAVLQGALGSGQMPDQDTLSRALSGLALDQSRYATQADYIREQAGAAHLASALLSDARSQLTVEERAVALMERNLSLQEVWHQEELHAIDSQIAMIEAQRDAAVAGLDQQLALAQAQIDGINGVATNVATLSEVTRAIATYEQAERWAMEQLTALDRQLRAAEAQHAREIEALDQIITDGQRQVDAINGATSAVMSVQRAIMGLESAIEAMGAHSGLQSFSGGGIATGPASGYLAELHGTEAVVPLKGGSIPVRIHGDAGSAASLLRDLRADNAQLRELLTEATRELKAIRNSSSDTAGTLRRIDRIGPRYIEEEKIA